MCGWRRGSGGVGRGVKGRHRRIGIFRKALFWEERLEFGWVYTASAEVELRGRLGLRLGNGKIGGRRYIIEPEESLFKTL